MDKPLSACTGRGECLSCIPEHAVYRGTALRCIALFTVKRPERCAQVDIFRTPCLGLQGPPEPVDFYAGM